MLGFSFRFLAGFEPAGKGDFAPGPPPKLQVVKVGGGEAQQVRQPGEAQAGFGAGRFGEAAAFGLVYLRGGDFVAGGFHLVASTGEIVFLTAAAQTFSM